jgi:hypothetical protein
MPTTWYEVDLTHRVDRFDVDKTLNELLYTDCIWTPEKLQVALAVLAEKKEGISDLRVTSINQIDEPPKSDPRRRGALNLDTALGI